ncbi:MAG: hypothetical protein K8F92_13360 [Hyphomicrobium sp.]|uniref:hypothetical protein n=1 Tax=Hyphomicrobium sp. TaxID=82 RepID=UPI00132BFEFF|nr:hypothetical protein [Hyphomicrobium sp.]KAB2943671.1 MAG: hypothetical protein F9K20_03175 [Hyphomicrobium sp.]MBZ0210629.1 hypothetical protein [Hyphomicrobium sp.]
MRAVTSELDSGSPTESFLRVLDQFAALRTYSSASPTVGGYRVLAPRRAASRKPRRSYVPPPSTVAALAGARMRLTGFLSVLFIGGLGLAVLAGPASCPCSTTSAVAERSSLSRLGYVQNARLVSAREIAMHEPEPAVLSNAALLEPDAIASGVSPITTSALESSRDIPSFTDDLAAIKVGRLPGKIEQLVEAGPPPTIRLAAAPSAESDVPPPLPAIEVATPPMTEVTATDAERVAAPRLRSPRKRMSTRAYRTPNRQAPLAKKAADAQLAQRAPKWAQQMFMTPWQSQAFSYTQ